MNQLENTGFTQTQTNPYVQYANAFNNVLGGVNGAVNAWTGLQNYQLALKQAEDQKKFSTLNLNNSVQSYNTALQDTYASRTSNPNAEAIAAYMAQNKLTGI